MSDKWNWKSPQFVDPSKSTYKWLLLGNIILALIAVIGSSVSAGVAATTIQGALIFNATEFNWISTSYLALFTLSLLISPWLSERYGYKKIFFVFLFVFLFGAVGGGCANNFWTLLLFRIIEGAGGGVVFTVGLILVTHYFSGHALALAIALFMGLGYGLGFMTGFLIGGYFGWSGAWQYIFFANLIFGLPALLVTALLFQETEKKPTLQFDVGGYCFFALFFALLISALNNAKAPWNSGGWTSPFMLTCFTLSLLSLIFLVMMELKRGPEKHPVVLLSLFKIRSFTVGSLTVLLVGANLFATLVGIPVFLEKEMLYDKWKIALMLMPIGASLGIVGGLSGVLAKYVNVRIISLAGLALIILSCYMNQFITIECDKMQIGIMLFIRGCGISLALGSLTSISLSEIPKELAGPASGLNSFFRQAVLTMGGSIAGAMVVQRATLHVARYASQTHPSSPMFSSVLHNLANHLAMGQGTSPEETGERALRLIRDNLNAQAHITALNDVFFILGWATFFSFLFLLGMTISYYLEKNPSHPSPSK